MVFFLKERSAFPGFFSFLAIYLVGSKQVHGVRVEIEKPTVWGTFFTYLSIVAIIALDYNSPDCSLPILKPKMNLLTYKHQRYQPTFAKQLFSHRRLFNMGLSFITVQAESY